MVVIDPPQASLDLLRKALNDSSSNYKEEEDETVEVLSYVASLASILSKSQNFASDIWIDSLSPYISTIQSNNNDDVESIINTFRTLSENATMADDDDDSDVDDDIGGAELCNIRFSLAYGGKILLHQTKLKLRRGHRYALVGQNGAGKTTLMTAINVSFVLFCYVLSFLLLCVCRFFFQNGNVILTNKK